MYRYGSDSTLTYTAQDLLLFNESPFASWMERLTLENPGHGIEPDAAQPVPGQPDSLVDESIPPLDGTRHLRIDPTLDESDRRRATLAAMRSGADYITGAQLAVGPLSDRVSLLTRASGYSDLGDWLYLPCDTGAKTDLQVALRLCFCADLLHSVQGQMPPQMLILRPGSDLLTLATDDHIYHYQSLKQRFMLAQREFRKHRMPDPAESSHFGRWSHCAHELLRERQLDDVSYEAEEGQTTTDEVEFELLQPDEVSAEGTVAAEAGGEPVTDGSLADLPLPEVDYEELNETPVRPFNSRLRTGE